MEQPTLETERLRLRPFRLSDAAEVQQLAGDREVAKTTLNIPHPYEDGMAEDWIQRHAGWFVAGTQVVFAIVLKESDALVGAIGLGVKAEHKRAEMGYWIGRSFWNKGYATEAGRALLAFGFEALGLHRIFAGHYHINPASGRVMAKMGMKKEGHFPQHILKSGQFVDMEYYGVLKEDFLSRKI